MKNNYLTAIFASLMVLAGCNQFDELEDIRRVDFDAEYAVPLVDTRTTMRDILRDFETIGSLTIDPDGLFRFRYQQEVVTQNSQDIFNQINAALPPIIPVSSPFMALPFASPDGLEIDRLDLKKGSMIYFFENRHSEMVTVTMTFPQVTKGGVPLVFRQTVSGYSGSGNAPAGTNLLFPASLAGYTIATENDSIYVQYEAIRASGQKDTLSSVFLRLQDLEFSYAEGYFGNFLYEGTRDTLSIDFFDNWIRGDIYFEEPRITLLVENSFGIPTRSVVNALNVITVKKDVLPLKSIFVDNGIDFPYPGFNEVGQVKTGAFSFTKQNSNIDVILGAGPIAIDYDVDAITNPDNDPGIRGFIAEDSYYRVNMEVELPMYGQASGFVAVENFAVDFKNYTDVSDVEFKVVVDNAIPLAIDIQAYFLDSNNQIIDSLLAAPQRFAEAAPVDAQGLVTGETRTVSYAFYSGPRFERIKDESVRLLLNTAISSLNNGTKSVKLFSQQDVKVKIGAKLGVRK
ncbi:MAG TPA: hypothetical protein PKC76_00040 [Saprospiraceae bacterium]|nr:hypothetical protein [Saprospiraceae bacterium]HMP22481.1 hypothetical protein [Saprospiraceae bacterium]